MCLVNISECNCTTNIKCSLWSMFLSHYHSEKSCFPCTIRPDYTNNSVWWQTEFKVFEKHFVIKWFCDRTGFNNFIAEPGAVRNEYFKLIFLLLHILIKKVLISAQPCFWFCMAGFWRHSYPFKLPFKYLPSFDISFFLWLKSLCFLFKPWRIIAFPGYSFSPVEFKDPPGNIIKEITVVCYADYSAFVLLQCCFKPLNRFGVEVICRFI